MLKQRLSNEEETRQLRRGRVEVEREARFAVCRRRVVEVVTVFPPVQPGGPDRRPFVDQVEKTWRTLLDRVLHLVGRRVALDAPAVVAELDDDPTVKSLPPRGVVPDGRQTVVDAAYLL